MTSGSSPVHDPFATPIQGYYTTPELTQRFNLIQHLIQNSEQLLLILAELGCGKTSLLKEIKASARENWWCHVIASSPAMSPEAFISTLLAAFNVRQEGKSWQVLHDSLRSHIAATRYNNQLPILLVDDAHLLPLATLKTIVEFAIKGEPQTRLRVLLFCEPQITSILATPEFEMVHNTLVHTLDIPALSRHQVHDYLLFYLKDSPFSTVHPFGTDVIKKIFAQSGGIPRRINLIAQPILHKFAEQMPNYTVPVSSSSRTYQWIGSAIILLILMGLISYWQFSDPIVNNSVQPREVILPLPLQPTSPIDTANETDNTEVNDPVESSTTVPDTMQPTKSPVIETDVKPQQLLANDKVKDETWLLQQDPSTYTLQVLGAYDYVTLKNFLAKQEPSDQFALFKTEYHNKDWYVLVYGLYHNRAEALVALAQLPAPLRQTTQPWARPLNDIQTHIQQRLQHSNTTE